VLKQLGEELQRARQERSLSLKAVAEPARITAPYLQKLERGMVDTPSPRVLGRLAAVLHIPYLRLLELAGYLDEAPRCLNSRYSAPRFSGS
jgi:transcriptional regulator with XRE-family HTH domain